MIAKGCVHHIVKVRVVTSEIPSFELILFVNEFLNVFPNDLPGVPLERNIDFGIDLLFDT